MVEGVEVDSEVEGGGQADSGEGEGGGEKGGSVYSIRRRLATERKGVSVFFFIWERVSVRKPVEKEDRSLMTPSATAARF